MVNAAVETVLAAVESGDVRAALAVLRGTGTLAGDRPPIGPEDPDEVAQEAELSKMEREALRAQRRALASRPGTSHRRSSRSGDETYSA